MTSVTKTEYLTCAETARLVRTALKKAFPGVKFKVRSQVYASTASIYVSWMDGPREQDVANIARRYEAADTDSMVGSIIFRDHYLRPDGEVLIMYSPGTHQADFSDVVDNRDLAPVMPAGIRKVHFGAYFISCQHGITDFKAKEQKALAFIREHCHGEGQPGRQSFGNEWALDLARRMVYNQSEGETIELVFNRIVRGNDSVFSLYEGPG